MDNRYDKVIAELKTASKKMSTNSWVDVQWLCLQLQELKEREGGKRPIIIRSTLKSSSYVCSKCMKNLKTSYKYCPHCGQKIEW